VRGRLRRVQAARRAGAVLLPLRTVGVELVPSFPDRRMRPHLEQHLRHRQLAAPVAARASYVEVVCALGDPTDEDGQVSRAASAADEGSDHRRRHDDERGCKQDAALQLSAPASAPGGAPVRHITPPRPGARRG
jgi:hypothetical protein